VRANKALTDTDYYGVATIPGNCPGTSPIEIDKLIAILSIEEKVETTTAIYY